MALDSTAITNQISSTMDLARNEAQSMVTAANNLVNNAVEVLTQYTPTYPEDPVTLPEYGADFGSGDSFAADQKPLGFPTIRTPNTVAMGALGDLDTIDDTFDAEAPTLNLPTYTYSTPTPLSASVGAAPTIDGSVTAPDAPTIDYPDLPTLLALRTDIPVDELVLPTASFTLPTYNNLLSTTFSAEFIVGKALVPNPDTYGMELVNRFFPGALDLFAQLQSKVQGVLGGTTTALTDLFDDHLYESLRTRIQAESSKAEQALDDAALTTGWEMPGAVRAAGLARIRQDLASNLGVAALEVYTKRADRELQHLQFILTLAGKLQDSAIALFGNAFGMQMQAFDAALRYGDTASKFAMAVYQLYQHDFELLSALVDKQIAIYDALLRAELAKTEVTKALLAVEKLKSEQNHDLIAQYTAQLQGQETKARLYNGQIESLKLMLEARKIPLDEYLANVQGFNAMASAKKNEYDLLQAQISGDEAKTRGELGKLEVYKTQATVFSTKVDARSKKIAAQSQRNQQILEEFKTRLGAEVDLTKLDVDVAEQAVKAYTAMAQVFLAESEERLNTAKFAFQQTLETAKIDLEQKRLSYERQFKSLDVEIARVKAIADISLNGAQVQAHVGAAAMSVMNTMVQLEASVSG